jgi:hypothetical protein
MGVGALVTRIIGIYLVVKGLGFCVQAFHFPWSIGSIALGAALVLAGAVFFARAGLIAAKIFPVARSSSRVEIDQLQLVAFRVIGLFILTEAAFAFFVGSLSTILLELFNPSPPFGQFESEAFNLRVLYGALASLAVAIVQGALGFWLLLTPESLVGRIDRWRARRSMEPIEQEVDD